MFRQEFGEAIEQLTGGRLSRSVLLLATRTPRVEITEAIFDETIGVAIMHSSGAYSIRTSRRSVVYYLNNQKLRGSSVF